MIGAKLGQVATRGAGVTLAGQGVRFVIQFIGLAVLSRILTPHQVGLVAMVTAILNVAEIIRDFGLSSAAIQAKSLSCDERTNLFWLNVAIGTACTIVAAALSPLLAVIYHEPAVAGISMALSGLFIISGANTQYRADLSRSLRFTALAVTDVLAQMIGAVVGVGSALAGAGYWAIVFQQASFVMTSFVVNLIQARWLPTWPRRGVSVRRFVRFGAHLLGANLMGFVVNNADNVGIGIVCGPGPLGLYSRAFQLLQMPLQQVNAPMTRVVLPLMSQLVDDRAAYLHFFRRFQLGVCLVLGLGFAVLSGLSAPLVQLLFGARWADAAPLLCILAVSGVFKGMDSANYQIWVSRALTGQLLKFYSVSRPLMVLTILAGLPWGPVGVATGQLVAAVLHWLIGLRYVCRLSGFDASPLLAQSWRVLGIVIAPAGVFAYSGTLVARAPVVQIGFGFMAALLWTALATLLVRPLRNDVTPLWFALCRSIRRA